uniref:Centromere protein C n=1 Tax=Noccaea caerulescens TaxID=107243 RepID=A0A1J3G8H8_NOCCA
MAGLSRSSNLEEDPLHAYSGLSLFPRTLKSLSNPLPPPNYQSDDLQQTHTLLESMPFEIRQEHQEQAKVILDDSSELLKLGIGTSVASQDTNEGVKMNPIPNKRERRPALERKRGHFTFKAKTSQQPQNEPTFDPSKYPNPDDFFAAFEKYQNAQREWQKQTGAVVTDTHQNQPSRPPRRPEIPGRKRGSYKHTYTDSYFTDLRTSEKENPIPSEQSLERTTAAHVTTADREVDDSTVDAGKNLKNILTELLSCSPDELEGDAGVKLLNERLNIKPVDKEMLSFPEFPDVRRMDLKASGRNPSNQRTALSNIQNLPKGINSDATRKNSLSSSSNPPADHTSVPDRHYLVPGDRQSREVDLAKDLNVGFGSSVANNADKVITNASPSNLDTTYVASDFNSSVQKSSCKDGSDTHSGIRRSHSGPVGNADNCVGDSITNRNSGTPEVNVDMQTKGNEVDVPVSESEANRNTGRRGNDADINEGTKLLDNLAEYASREAARMDPFTVEEDNIPDHQDESSKSPNRAPEQYNTMDGSFEHAEHIQGQHGEENDNTDTACGRQEENAQEVHNSAQKQTSKQRKRGGSSDSNMKKRSKTVRDESEGDEQTKTLSHESGAKKQPKRKSNEREEKKKQMKKVTREGKIFSRRKSLAAAGTKWESGVRRSTRIKSRPLEYWRGEKFLFGRIHESLTTVIGIKYASASPDEKGKREKQRILKVKSFVSDDYKELVDSASLH